MRKVVVGILVSSLVGCAMGHRDPVEIKQALNEAANNANSRSLDNLPTSVQVDLLPELDNHPEQSSSSLKRFRVQANDIDAKTFFASIIHDTEYSAAIHPEVSGRITVNLSDVSLEEVLDVARVMYGYDIVKLGKIIQVYPSGIRTETFPVDYLQFKRTGSTLTTISTSTITSKYDDDDNNSNSNSSSSNSNSSSNYDSINGGTTIETVSESDFWVQLEASVQALVGSDKGRAVVASPQAGVISVKASPDELRDVSRFLHVIHGRLHRQVILETKILEVTLNDGYQQGIDWSNLSIGNGNDVSISRTAISSVLPGMSGIGELLGGQTNITISNGSFDSVLSFMSTQGDLNVLSSPRVTATNNQKSVIKVGIDEYFVTGVSTDYIDVGDNSEPRTEYELAPFFSGISLDVTPQIDDNGNVLLHVHPAVIEVEEKKLDFLNNAPMAKSSIRESDSVIRAKDGDVVVIGGLMKSYTYEQVSKVPLLGDIPVLGHLFRNTNNMTEKTELVILLKPTVVGVHTWQQEIDQSRDLLQEWFPGSE